MMARPASVTRYGHAGVEQVCSEPAKANRLKMIPPPQRAGDADYAAFHSITSSARASSIAGISRPSDFVVLRLMTSAYLEGCSIVLLENA
jgi:hypothetical protein